MNRPLRHRQQKKKRKIHTWRNTGLVVVIFLFRLHPLTCPLANKLIRLSSSSRQTKPLTLVFRKPHSFEMKLGHISSTCKLDPSSSWNLLWRPLCSCYMPLTKPRYSWVGDGTFFHFSFLRFFPTSPRLPAFPSMLSKRLQQDLVP